MILIFVGGVLISGLILERVLHQAVQAEISSKAYTLLATMSAVRDYTNSEIMPQIEPLLQDEFLPASVPSYSAQQVFEKLRQQDADYRQFLYKEAAVNPTSLRDSATPFETSLIEKFQDRSLSQLSGFYKDADRERFFYMALPSVVTSPSCLNCHSTPDIAPASLIARYGSENGFGWALNDVVGTRLIYLPDRTMARRTYRLLPWAIAAIAGVLAIALGSLYARIQQSRDPEPHSLGRTR